MSSVSGAVVYSSSGRRSSGATAPRAANGPEDRQRADRLQVPNLEAPVIEPDVSLDERAAEQLRCAEVVDAVAGPVGDQERSPRRLRPGIRGRGRDHDQRV